MSQHGSEASSIGTFKEVVCYGNFTRLIIHFRPTCGKLMGGLQEPQLLQTTSHSSVSLPVENISLPQTVLPRHLTTEVFKAELHRLHWKKNVVWDTVTSKNWIASFLHSPKATASWYIGASFNPRLEMPIVLMLASMWQHNLRVLTTSGQWCWVTTLSPEK